MHGPASGWVRRITPRWLITCSKPMDASAVPTPEHYLPLLYVAGAGMPGEAVSFPVQGMDGGSISMLAVQIGARAA